MRIQTKLWVRPAAAPSVTVAITDEPGSNYCRLAYSVRGLEANTWYLLHVTGGSPVAPDFTTDARGTYKQAYFNVVRSAFNNTNTITTTLYVANSGQPPIETKTRVTNRCPAGLLPAG